MSVRGARVRIVFVARGKEDFLLGGLLQCSHSGAPSRFCDGLSRRSFLKIGAFGAGLTLAEMLRAKSLAATAGKGSANKAAIMIYLPGGPSHMDMYDLKPEAPAEFRGEFKPIATNVPGVQICEHMPLQAAMFDKLAVVRSIQAVDEHSDSEAMTGYSENVNRLAHHPSIGSVVSKLRGDGNNDIPPFVNLPPGNRWGDFTIAPGGAQPGAVNGSENGTTGAGSHSTGGGGDRVPGVGPGFAGGGGGNSGTSGNLSISGEPGPTGQEALDATIFREMVYPVPSTMVLRKNALVVSAGPMGGGGLSVYGALHCGKIYTVFLPMPGQPWTLQFCQSGAAKPADQNRSAVVHMEQGILQPDVTTRFDFKRLPVPFEKKNKPIVLKGIIKEDGTVAELKVFQGIVPAMDEAARVAFSRWKFKPAIRDGKHCGG